MFLKKGLLRIVSISLDTPFNLSRSSGLDTALIGVSIHPNQKYILPQMTSPPKTEIYVQYMAVEKLASSLDEHLT